MAERVISVWSPAWEGVDYATGYSTTPRPVRVNAMRVDLLNPAVGMHSTPGNGGAALETALRTTVAYANAYPTVKAAINANFFSVSGSNADNRGLLISGGSTISPHEGAFPTQLRITAGMVASIVAGTSTPAGIHTAIAGDAFMLNGGVHFGENSTLNPHTAVGLSQNGRFLYLLVVDGRQPGWSDGCTIWELGWWLSDLGAWWGMNLDGGGSTCMVSKFGSSAMVLNRPSDGSPRAVGANLGVITSDHDSRIDAFVRATDDTIRQKYWRSLAGWSPTFANLGAPAGGAASDPASVSWGPRRLDVFCLGTNGQLYQRNYNGAVWSSDWSSLGGALVGSPDVCSWEVDRLDVFGRSPTNTLVHRAWNGTTWGPWEDLGGSITSDPSAVSWAPGRIDVFARGSEGDLQHKWYIQGTGWSGWESLGGALQGGPDACSRYRNHIGVFYRGTDSALKHRFYEPGTSWSLEINLGGVLYSDPGVVSRGRDFMEVFARGGNGALYHKYFVNGTGWSAWSGELGGVLVGGPDAASWSNDAGKR
jgi:hypothetical protein